MRTLFNTIRNIWKIDDLRIRILTTLGFILIYRLGSFVTLPGIDPSQLSALENQTSDGLLGLLNLFTGGAFSQASIMALGIMPYISASIVIQLLGVAVPYIQKLQREGESGRTKINQLTRYLTILITGVQGPGYIANIKATLPETAFLHNIVASQDPSFLLTETGFWFSSGVILVTGTLFAMWLGEKITDRGIGNGISLLIMIGIIAALPQAFAFEFATKVASSGGGLVMLALELVFILVVILISILLVQGTRRIPVNYAKTVIRNRQYGGVRQYIPLKINAAGVMPIIFAQAIMFIPITIAGFSSSTAASGFVQEFSDFGGFWYNFVFAVLVIVFTYFYTAITINTTQMAADMKRNNAFITERGGVRQGKETAKYLDNVMSRIVLPGSFFLAFVAILPAFAMQAGVNPQFAQFYGGTSLLIMVGVVLDTIQQINAHLINRHYDGLMKKGRRTRSGM
ncbi:MAG: preprotein translocase subunit SecY [Flavobacteriales bacterium]|nr:preprotein translocase subunit SecY [Flavobacteriales bacterium]|tara:strand:+ start:8960 stop:10330 length:1371 start_codon:yes stop_codon:yes gene_type:complete